MVILTTTHGDITIELFEDDAPISVENFLAYVDEGFFDGTIFHRVIPNFMIQGGGLTEGLQQKSMRFQGRPEVLGQRLCCRVADNKRAFHTLR